MRRWRDGFKDSGGCKGGGDAGLQPAITRLNMAIAVLEINGLIGITGFTCAWAKKTLFDNIIHGWESWVKISGLRGDSMQ